MNIKFSAIDSRIYDFITFLSSRFYVEKSHNEYEGMDDCCYVVIHELFKETEYLRDKIDKFYFKGLSLFGDFLYSYPLWGCEDEKVFLDALVNLSEEKLKKTILFSLIKAQEIFMGPEDIEKIQMIIDDIYLDEMKTLRYIQQSPFDDEIKWKVFTSFCDSEKARDEYVELMMEILPIFIKLYKPSEEAVKSYGESMLMKIKERGSCVITNMWKGIYLDEREDGYFIENHASHLLISSISSLQAKMNYQIRGEDNCYIFGLEVENGLQRLRKSYKDTRNKMVFFFKNLGDDTRYEILNLIANGVASNKEIADSLNLTTATISYHLGNLINANLIKNVKNDKGKKFEVNEIAIGKILDEFLIQMKIKQEY